MERFTGFRPATFAYLADLAAHNDRDWFEANRDRYEHDWRDPALAFITALRPGLETLPLPLRAEPALNRSLRRIQRDTRFSADKSPYRPALHMLFWPGGAPNRGAGLHVVLHPDGLSYGAGLWAFEGPALSRFRDRLGDAANLNALRAALAAAGEVGCTLDPPQLKRPAPGPEDAADLLRHKGIVARTRGEGLRPDWLGQEAAVDEVLTLARALLPLIAWLHAV